ncbi:MAG: hypothetical protein JNJ59_05120 [Deltaproteobacteria bacterium]|nr:hypothetical protein [Deltaproteobacteria bacterium]
MGLMLGAAAVSSIGEPLVRDDAIALSVLIEKLSEEKSKARVEKRPILDTNTGPNPVLRDLSVGIEINGINGRVATGGGVDLDTTIESVTVDGSLAAARANVDGVHVAGDLDAQTRIDAGTRWIEITTTGLADAEKSLQVQVEGARVTRVTQGSSAAIASARAAAPPSKKAATR